MHLKDTFICFRVHGGYNYFAIQRQKERFWSQHYNPGKEKYFSYIVDIQRGIKIKTQI